MGRLPADLRQQDQLPTESNDNVGIPSRKFQD